MKIPSKIQIGPHEYTIEFTKPKDTERQRGNWGKTFLEEKRILIDSELPQSQIEETLIHEMLHICFFQAGLSYDVDDKVILTEEQIIARLTPFIYMAFNHNNLFNKNEEI